MSSWDSDVACENFVLEFKIMVFRTSPDWEVES